MYVQDQPITYMYTGCLSKLFPLNVIVKSVNILRKTIWKSEIKLISCAANLDRKENGVSVTPNFDSNTVSETEDYSSQKFLSGRVPCQHV